MSFLGEESLCSGRVWGVRGDAAIGDPSFRFRWLE